MNEALRDARLPVEPRETAAVRPDPQAAVAVFEDRADAVLEASRQHRSAGFGVQSSQPEVAADPHLAGCIAHDREDVVPLLAGAGQSERHELAARGIQPAQAGAPGARVYVAVGIDKNAADDVAADTRRSLGIVTVGRERPARAVHAGDAGAVRGEPQIAVRVFRNVEYEIAAERSRIPALAPVVAELVAVETIETVFGSDPEQPLAVLVNGQDVALRQPLVQPETVETHREALVRGGDACRQNEKQYRRERQQVRRPRYRPRHSAAVLGSR